ncbi:MAG: beta-galactosidase [Clostridia bacterium]|nr:beta-galactosidase [Clostridia bacterium]
MIPRPEHPNPDFCRKGFENLNGQWEFAFDEGNSGEERGLQKPDAAFPLHITVPFCPESELSGIGRKDFVSAVWYRRTLTLTEDQLAGRLFVVFGAVDFHARVFVNGELAGEHYGGYTSFRIEITALAHPGENVLTVRVEDDTRSPLQARGKQSEEYYSHGCDYTRTTGIWQTVYLEWTPKAYLKSVKYYPNIENATLTVVASVEGKGTFSAAASWEGREVGSASVEAGGQSVALTVPLSEKHLWEVGKGGLYGLTLRFGDDEVTSYFGLREVKLEDGVFKLNGKPVFQRLVLDQGFYPDGIYTAPTAEALRRDIELSQAVGFNGARLHQKIFEPLFLHYADERGYLVWGEHGNWGMDHSDFANLRYFLTEIEEEIARDFNHPALIGWCPFNETWDVRGRRQDNDVLRVVYRTVKALDATRPVIDTSGNFHVETDIYDLHDYDQDPAVFRDRYTADGAIFDPQSRRQTWRGEPVFMSEYGGIGWTGDRPVEGWGYGNNPTTLEEFYDRYKGLTDALLDCPRMLGFCYTQLTDVEQERNGVYFYDRTPKFDAEKLRAVNSRPAAIEKE